MPFSTVSGTGTGIFLTRSRAGLLTNGGVVSVATLRRWPLPRCAAWWVAWPLWGRAARFLLSLLGGRVCGLAVWPCVFGRLALSALLCWGGLCVVGGRAWAAWLRFLRGLVVPRCCLGWGFLWAVFSGLVGLLWLRWWLGLAGWGWALPLFLVPVGAWPYVAGSPSFLLQT